MLLCLSLLIFFSGEEWKGMKIPFGLPVLLCKYLHATLDTLKMTSLLQAVQMPSLASLLLVGSVRLSVYQENLSATPYADHEIILHVIFLSICTSHKPQQSTRKQGLVLPMHLCLTALLLEYGLYFPPGALQSLLAQSCPLCSAPSQHPWTVMGCNERDLRQWVATGNTSDTDMA